MSDLALVVTVAVITYASRVMLLIWPLSVGRGLLGRFLEVFPLALFVSIATSGLLAPEGSPAMGPGVAAAVGGVVGAVVFRRSLWAILAVGALAFYGVRALL